MPVKAIAFEVVKESSRKKVFYVALLFFLILTALTPMLPSFRVGVRIELFKDLSLGLTSLFSLILALALTAGHIPAEVERRFIYNVLSKPVRRAEYICGKYLGIMITMLIIMLLMGAGILALMFLNFSHLDLNVFEAIFTLYLEVGVISAFVLFVSVYFSAFVNVFFAILFYVVGHSKGILLEAARKGYAGSSKAIFVNIISYLLPNLEILNINSPIAHNVHVPIFYIGKLFLYALTTILFFLGLTIISFGRKDL